MDWTKVNPGDNPPADQPFIAAIRTIDGFYYAVVFTTGIGMLEDANGDDFGYTWQDVAYWMPLPTLEENTQ